MFTFFEKCLLKQTVLAITIYSGLYGGTAYAGVCRVKDPDVAGFYSGQCVEGVAHGKGIAKGRDVYIGEFKNGGAHGFGAYVWGAGSLDAGDIYVGEWINGERTGNDLYIVKGKYSAEGKDITHSGTCRVNDPDISGSYVGECVAGFAHGKGVAKGRNEYMGMFKNGNKHGKGAYLWGSESKTPEAIFIGESNNDKIIKGILINKSEETMAIENNLQNRIDELIIKAEAASKAFKILLTSGTPEELYLSGVKSETESDYDRASTLYNQVISRFAKAPVALKAADRLLAIRDKLDMQKRDTDAMLRSQQEKLRSQQNATDQTYIDFGAAERQRNMCRAQVATCKSSCPKNKQGITSFDCIMSCSVNCD